MTFRIALAISLGLAVTFLALPVAAIFVEAHPADLIAALDDPGSRDALWLSLRATLAAVTIVVAIGTPAAWMLTTRRFRGRAVAVTIVELPLVLPPAVAGVGLLAAFGPQGLIANDVLSLHFSGVVAALAFVSSPFYVRQAMAAFEAVDPEWLDASRTLGASEARTFARVAIPAALSGLAAGLALAWGRALGEFGATLMFAGSFRGITQTAPLAIYERLGPDFTGALALSAVLVGASAGILAAIKVLSGRAVA